ncbi:hypothetical protein [Paenibacillus hodogayensis]|uniref:hypothetical protein n=1 Tax=Paenibacillus hodogayensis TaxID=279208 RepID=UPI0031EFC293
MGNRHAADGALGQSFDVWVMAAYQMLIGGAALLLASPFVEQPYFEWSATQLGLELFVLLWMILMRSIAQFVSWYYRAEPYERRAGQRISVPHSFFWNAGGMGHSRRIAAQLHYRRSGVYRSRHISRQPAGQSRIRGAKIIAMIAGRRRFPGLPGSLAAVWSRDAVDCRTS